jgi:hypothetical protein
MQIKYHILLALVGASAIIGAGYTIGSKAYEEGISVGIDAVINECAKHDQEPMVAYNGKTGAVMVCGGDTLTQPQIEPSRPLPEPPSGTAGEPEHHRSIDPAVPDIKT